MAKSGSPFVWYELLSTDVKGGKAFYSKVVGWGLKEWEGQMEYSMFTADDGPAAGVMTLPEEAQKMGAPTHWLGYVAVDDVDAAASKVTSLGGQVHVPPQDIPEVGRFSVVADPQGAVFALYKALPMEGPDPLEQMRKPGHCGWHELYAVDAEKVFEFYSDMFGWTKGTSMDMGPMGTYQTFNIGETQIGGMMNKPNEMPVPAWSYYFNVGNIDEAAGRIRGADGQIITEAMEVPGGGWIVNGIDPQGGMFSLYGSK